MSRDGPATDSEEGPDRSDVMNDLFDGAPCGYLVADEQLRITRVNRRLLDWLSFDGADLVGRDVASIMPVGDRIVFSSHCLPQLAAAGGFAEAVVDVVASDGTRRPVLMTGVSVAATEHEPASVRIIVFSARERRLYENELLRSKRLAEESEARSIAAEERLRQRLTHDHLTELFNRIGIVEHLDAVCAAGEQVVTVLYVDIDDFKSVNDMLGHAAGDQVLLTLAERIVEQLNEDDVAARVTGDEFVIVALGWSEPEIDELAERLLGVIAQPIHIDAVEIVPNASIGVAASDVVESPDAEELIRRADLAMYTSKRVGRGGWARSDPDVDDRSRDRLARFEELRRALESDEFRLVYQPQVDLMSRCVLGVEALIRWKHPHRGFVGPFEFIDLAEQTGLIRPIGEWVLDTAIADAAAWNERRIFDVSVNLSARQLADPDLASIIVGLLDRHGLDPVRLTVEITETALMAYPEVAGATLHALDAHGIGIAIDDFGTGYASLTYLRQFPVSDLKVDRSFTAQMLDDLRARSIVEACIDLAHNLDLTVVAEGVEDEPTHSALVALGCDTAQGYLYDRPLMPDAITQIVAGDPAAD